MTSRTVIPRFLLPQQSPLWRGLRLQSPTTGSSSPSSSSVLIRVRHASSSSNAGKPLPPKSGNILAKPDKFNPPSHGSRLRRTTGGGASGSPLPSRHYGPTLSAEEVAQQNQRHYPGLMAPKGSWAHWFWHSRALHTVITLGTLLAMGIFTFFMNYATNSPFKDLVPPISDLWRQPLSFFASWRNVIVLHEKDKAIKAQEHRFASLDDAAKRKYYMKMHGIEEKNPVYIMFGKPEASEAELEAAALGTEVPAAESEEKPRKKWFGIF